MSRIYVGNLPDNPSERELRDIFARAGDILDIQIKRTISGSSFAFIHYANEKDAIHAVQELDGAKHKGRELRVEVPFQSREPRGRESFRSKPPRRGYPVKVYGIPPSGSWQDLKDAFRDAGEVLYADVFNDGTGIVELCSLKDAEYAVDMFDNSNFHSHQGEKSRIQVELLSSRHRGPPNMRSRPYESSNRDWPSVDEAPIRRGSPARWGPANRRSPPPSRRRIPRGRSPVGERRGAFHGDERYTTGDSRSTEAHSTTNRFRRNSPPPDRSTKASPPEPSQSSWQQREPASDRSVD